MRRPSVLLSVLACLGALTVSPATTVASSTSPGPVRAAATTFLDVPPTLQFATEIGWLAEKKIAGGWPDGTFRPTDAVSRDAMAAFLYRMAGRPPVKLPDTSPFKDVTKSSMFFREIVWMDQQGIAKGYPDGTFRPRDSIKRDAMAAFLYRLAGKPNVITPDTSPFRDVSSTSQFYKQVVWLVQQGITRGYPDGTFKPLNTVRRDATAAFLFRFYAQRLAGEETTRATVSSSGAQIQPPSKGYGAMVSDGGRYVAFTADATALAPECGAGAGANVYLRDTVAATTTCVTAPTSGAAAGGSVLSDMTPDGRFLVITSSGPLDGTPVSGSISDVYVWDRRSGAFTRVSAGQGGARADKSSFSGSISDDGSIIAFASSATNLVPKDTNGVDDVFVVDTASTQVTRLVASDGTQLRNGSGGPEVSGDGSTVAFYSRAKFVVPADSDALADAFAYDVATGTLDLVSARTPTARFTGDSTYVSISRDGRYVAFSSYGQPIWQAVDDNGSDIYVRDRVAGVTTLASTTMSGAPGTGAILPSISADGRYVAFETSTWTIVPNDGGARDVFVVDRWTGVTRLASISSTGRPGNDRSGSSVLSADGARLAYVSRATNLVPDDTNATADVFVTRLLW